MCDEADLVADNVLIGVLFSLEQGKRRKGLFDPSRVDADIVLKDGKQTWFRLWPPQHVVHGGDPDDESEGHESGAEDDGPVPSWNVQILFSFWVSLKAPPHPSCLGPVVTTRGLFIGGPCDKARFFDCCRSF